MLSKSLIQCRACLPSLRSGLRHRLSFYLLLILFATVCRSFAPNELRADVGVPPPCLGFNPETKLWGARAPSPVEPEVICPNAQAFVGVSSRSRQRAKASIAGHCCPVPENALLNEHSWSSDVCPDGAVVTGARWTEQDQPSIRCSMINQVDYELHSPQPGQRLELAEDFPAQIRDTVLGRSSKRTPRASIPVSLRYGLGRTSRTSWEASVCIGAPPGSLLSGLNGTECNALVFRELKPRSASIHPPPCAAVDNPFSERARCVSREIASERLPTSDR